MGDLKGVEVLSVGTWVGSRAVKFIEQDLDDIIKITNGKITKTGKRPPLKLGHSNNQLMKGQTDGDPAMGFIQNLRKKGSKIIADFVNMPDILIEAIKKSRFTNVSSEVEFDKNGNWFLTAVAILGADLPAIKNLQDLQAFLSENPLKTDSEQVAPALKLSEPFFKSEVRMTEQKNTDLELEKLKLAQTQKDSEAEKIQAEQAKEIAELKAQNTAIEFSGKKEKILTEYKADVDAKKLMPAIFAKIESHLESQKATFSAGSELTLSIELSKEIAKGYSFKTEESGYEDGSTDEQSAEAFLNAEANKAMLTQGIDYKQALGLVCLAYPDKERAYVAQNNTRSGIPLEGGN